MARKKDKNQSSLLLCPWCSSEMRFNSDENHAWYECGNCWAVSPKCKKVWRSQLSTRANLQENKNNALFLIERSDCKSFRWISTKERLPPDRQFVLMMMPDCPLKEGIYLETTGFEYYDKDSKPWGWKNVDSLVTHWMPLPEPPKEDAK